MQVLLYGFLAFAEPVEEESDDSSSPESNEQEDSSTETQEKPTNLPSKVDKEAEPEVSDTSTESPVAEPEESTEMTEDRFQAIVQLDGMALVLPSIEFGGGEKFVPTFTSGFMLNVGLGFRLWEGKEPESVPLKEYIRTAEPMVEVVAGAHIAYEEGRDRLNEAYAVSVGGYLGFFDSEDRDIDSGWGRIFADAGKGVMIGLSKRRSLDYEQIELTSLQRQWQLEATLSQSFDLLQIYQFSSLGFGNESLPWRSTYGIGVGAAF